MNKLTYDELLERYKALAVTAFFGVDHSARCAGEQALRELDKDGTLSITLEQKNWDEFKRDADLVRLHKQVSKV